MAGGIVVNRPPARVTAARLTMQPEAEGSVLVHNGAKGSFSTITPGVAVQHVDPIEGREVVPVLRGRGRLGDPLEAEPDVVGGHLRRTRR